MVLSNFDARADMLRTNKGNKVVEKTRQQGLTMVTLLLLSLVASPALSQSVRYAFEQDPTIPTRFTALAVPNFSSGDVTVSTATFTFMLPEGTATAPDLNNGPTVTLLGANDITGIWGSQQVTPTATDGAGGTGANLSIAGQLHDVYHVVLQNSPDITTVDGIPVPLFFFDLPTNCMDGRVEILTNDGAVQAEILSTFGANFNNQTSVSIDNSFAEDRYAGNDSARFSFPCPLVIQGNNPPLAVNDFDTTPLNTPITVAILNNDSDPDGDAVQLVTFTQPTNGTVTLDDGGTPTDPTDDQLIYTPNNGFFGVDTFTYDVTDGNGGTASATVTITVEPDTIPPVAVSDQATTDPGVSVTLPVPSNDTDDIGIDPTSVQLIDPISSLRVSSVTIPGEGTFTVNPDGSVTFMPEPAFRGTSTVDYEIADTSGNTASASITVVVRSTPEVIPTLSPLTLLLMMLLLCVVAAPSLRRRLN